MFKTWGAVGVEKKRDDKFKRSMLIPSDFYALFNKNCVCIIDVHTYKNIKNSLFLFTYGR